MKTQATKVASCIFCGKQAVGTYARSGFNDPICATCRDEHTARDALEDQLHLLAELERSGRYGEAIALLEAIFAANRHLDHSRWLARSVGREKAYLLRGAGRYEEAERAWHARTELGFANADDRWETAIGLGLTLEDQGKLTDALSVLEEALSHQDPLYASSLYGPLGALARLSRKLGRPVDPKWLGLARDLADAYGVELLQGESVAEILLTLKDTVAGTLPRRAWEAGEDSEPDPDEDSPPDTAAT
jgi:tetratricopeptide (TPR) repeat protein